MGYIFNNGLTNQIIYTKAYIASYYDMEAETSHEAYYLLERPAATDIMPMVRAAGTTQTDFTIVKKDNNNYLYIRVTPGEITTSVSLHRVDEGIDSFRKRLAQFPPNEYPETYNIFFLYYVTGNGSSILHTICTHGEHNFLTISVEQITPSYPNGYLVGTKSPNKYEIDAFNVYSYEPPYTFNHQEFYRDPTCVASSPNQMILPIANMSWDDLASDYLFGATSMTQLTSADNTPPEDYVGPTPVPDPEEPFDPATPDPYVPYMDNTSDTISIPGNPVVGVSTAGFIHVYKITTSDLDDLGEILFPDMGTPTDIVDAVTKLYNVIANSNLINYVIDCHMIPVTPQIGSNSRIRVGYKRTDIQVPKVTSDYIDATCGSLNIREWFSGYQDYSLTRARLYLPFIGFVDMKPEFWQSGTISVDYKFNVIDGSFMCYIRSTSSKSSLSNSIIAQYGGNACMHFPITGVNYANMVSGIIGAGVSVATGGATAASIAGGAMSAMNTMIQKGHVQQSNSYNSTASLMGVRYPYLMIERPVPATPSGYGHDNGFPANITTALSGVVGYTEISDIDLSGIPLTQEELEELRGLLKEGVYF